jgi:hypothetical protein
MLSIGRQKRRMYETLIPIYGTYHPGEVATRLSCSGGQDWTSDGRVKGRGSNVRFWYHILDCEPQWVTSVFCAIPLLTQILYVYSHSDIYTCWYSMFRVFQNNWKKAAETNQSKSLLLMTLYKGIGCNVAPLQNESDANKISIMIKEQNAHRMYWWASLHL